METISKVFSRLSGCLDSSWSVHKTASLNSGKPRLYFIYWAKYWTRFIWLNQKAKLVTIWKGVSHYFIEGIILSGLGLKKIARVSYDYLWTILQLGRWKCTARERPENDRPNNRAWNCRTWHFRIWMKMQEMKCQALLNLYFVRNVRITVWISIAYFNTFYVECSYYCV